MLHIVKPLLRRPLMPVLVVLQVALACAIACNALFLLQQKLAPILAPDGIGDSSHVVALFNINAQGAPWSAVRMRALGAELRAIPGVAGVSYSSALPMVDTMLMEASVVGVGQHTKGNAVMYMGDHLVDTLGLWLVAGRNFTQGEESVSYGSGMGFHADGPVIITRALANRLFPDGHALGRTIHYADSPGGERTVVGVIAHLLRNRFGKDNDDLDYSMLFPGVAAQFPMGLFAARLKTPDVPRVCKALTAVVQRELGAHLTPDRQPQCDSFAILHNDMLAQPRAAVWLLSGVTLIVLIVTLTGIMGMTGYWVQQRTRSIGIRRALGARRKDILRELLVENALVVGLGMLLGLIAAYAINLWLMRHYELLRLPWIYLPVGAVLLLVLGQLAALTPALRASNVPPAVATRSV